MSSFKQQVRYAVMLVAHASGVHEMRGTTGAGPGDEIGVRPRNGASLQIDAAAEQIRTPFASHAIDMAVDVWSAFVPQAGKANGDVQFCGIIAQTPQAFRSLGPLRS